LALSFPAALAGEGVHSALEDEARHLAQRFVGELKPRLQQAMAEGGPVHAIDVCAGIAPRIADELSAESGWLVKRVSLKPRNPTRAVPDKWERGVLADFEARRAAGEAPADLVYAETVGSRYRFMQAQVVEGVCVACHGNRLSPEVEATLSEFYPDDNAVGYSPGDVRGAISLSKSLAGTPLCAPPDVCDARAE